MVRALPVLRSYLEGRRIWWCRNILPHPHATRHLLHRRRVHAASALIPVTATASEVKKAVQAQPGQIVLLRNVSARPAIRPALAGHGIDHGSLAAKMRSRGHWAPPIRGSCQTPTTSVLMQPPRAPGTATRRRSSGSSATRFLGRAAPRARCRQWLQQPDWRSNRRHRSHHRRHRQSDSGRTVTAPWHDTHTRRA